MNSEKKGEVIVERVWDNGGPWISSEVTRRVKERRFVASTIFSGSAPDLWLLQNGQFVRG